MYVSLFEDSEAQKSDAFSFHWPSNVYIFPPIPLISKALSKFFRNDVQFGLFISPAWISIPLLPILKNALISNPIFIPYSHILGCLPTRHPFPLVAWPISAFCARKKGSRPRFQMPLPNQLALPPSPHILGSGLDLWNGLVQENLSPICLPN